MSSHVPARRLVPLVFASLLMLQLGACSSCEDDVNNPTNNPTPDATIDVAIDFGDDVEPDQAQDVKPDVSDTTPDLLQDEGVDLAQDVSVDDEPDIVVTAIRLDAVVPPRGPLDGGTPFVLEGVGFTLETQVFFGSKLAQVDLINGRLVGQTPPGNLVGAVAVKVQDPVYGIDAIDGGFSYTATLAVDTVVPNRIPTQGGIEVDVRGRGFDDQTRVSFGGATALRHTLVNPNLLRVLAPSHPVGAVDVRVTNVDLSATLSEGVTYFEVLRLDKIRPASGVSAGGEAVELQGAGFVDGMRVDFDAADAIVQSVDPSGFKALVLTPAHAPGLSDVRVVLPNQDAVIAQDAFFFSDLTSLEVAKLTPVRGPESGGIEVSIVGVGLDTPGLSVTFDGASASIVSQESSVAIVELPAHVPGVVDVVIDDGQGIVRTLPDGFTYEPNLLISNVAPNTSDVAGNVPVTISGEGFTSATRVLFGANAAPFVIVDDQTITTTAPSSSAGPVDVIVERDNTQGVLPDGFVYTEALQVFGLSPVRGSIAGNTYIEIRGRGFVDPIDVTFDGINSPSVSIIDAQTIAVRAPAHAPGPVGVIVNQGAQSAMSPVPYTYFNPGARFGGAWGGPVNGAVNVTVFSTGGQPIENAFVMLSTRPDTEYQGFTDALGMVTLSGPQVFGTQTITAVAAEHSSATVQAVDAENITILLTEPPPPPESPPETTPAVFTGQLTGLNKLAEPSATQFPVAYVYTTQVDRFSQNPPAGPGSVLSIDGTYTIESRLGDLALIAVGGLFDNATGRFTPQRMGIKRYLVASEGVTYTEDLDLSIDLTASMSVKLNNAPSYPTGPNINSVRPWLDLGFDGVFGQLAYTESNSTVLTPSTLAPLTGILSDASYYIEGGAYTGVSNPPLSTAFAPNITDLTQLVELNLLDVAQIIEPLPAGRPVNNIVSFTYNSPIKPNLFYVRVQTAMQEVRWEAFLPGTATSVRLPEFPDFSNLPADQQPAPYGGELLTILIIGISQPGLSFDTFTYNDLGLDRWDGYSLAAQLIQL